MTWWKAEEVRCPSSLTGNPLLVEAGLVSHVQSVPFTITAVSRADGMLRGPKRLRSTSDTH